MIFLPIQHQIELFNLFTDRNEEHNLAEMYPEKVSSMKKDIEEWWSDCTKGTRLEGRTTFNSGWVVELMEQLQKEGKSLMDIEFFNRNAKK